MDAQILPPRKAADSDLQAIRNIIEAAYSKYLSRMDRKPSPLLRNYESQVKEGVLWVVGNPIVGLISLVQESVDCLLVENVAVHPSAQGRGIGRRLMEFAEQEARRRGICNLKLYTNEVMVENIAIYSHLGYVEVDRRIDDGYRRVFMQKTVNIM